MEGHELGNHSYNHSILVYKTPGFIKSQIDKTDNLIREAGYKGTIYVRPPKGYKLFFLPWLLKKTGRKLVLWSIMLGDWNNPPPAKMMEELDKKLKPGSIILLHDNIFTDENPMGTTVKLVELMLEKYTKLGYKFVTISQLIE